jgi:hypothetical protein
MVAITAGVPSAPWMAITTTLNTRKEGIVVSVKTANPTEPAAQPQGGELLPCEEWRPVPHTILAERYQVSSHGRVRSLCGPTPRLVKQWPDRDGYWRVSLYFKCKTFGFTVHTLVALAFVGSRPTGCECSHKDGNHQNNVSDNLTWETHLENEQRKTAQGKRPFGGKNHAAKLTATKVKALRLHWNNGDGIGLTTLARESGMSESGLYQALKGTTWKNV